MAEDFKERFKQAGLILADSINQAYGGKQNLYGTYQEQKTKRMEQEAKDRAAAQALEQQKFMNDIRLEQLRLGSIRVNLQGRGQDIALQKAIEAEKARNIRAGLRPIDIEKSVSPGGRLPSRAVTGAFGQMYVPDNIMIDLAAKKAAATAAATSEEVIKRGKAITDYRLQVQGTEKAPMSADAAGRYAFAKEAIRSSDSMEKLLFKDGVFNQGLVNKALAGKYTKDKDVQQFKRWSLGVLTAKGLIQSGTVIKDEEWKRLMDQYGVDLFSNADAVKGSLSETRLFMNEYMDAIKPNREKKQQSSNKATSGKIGNVPWSIVNNG